MFNILANLIKFKFKIRFQNQNQKFLKGKIDVLSICYFELANCVCYLEKEIPLSSFLNMCLSRKFICFCIKNFKCMLVVSIIDRIWCFLCLIISKFWVIPFWHMISLVLIKATWVIRLNFRGLMINSQIEIWHLH